MNEQRWSPWWRVSVALLALSGAGGCSSSTVEISGKVLLERQPISGAVIDFTLLDPTPKAYRGVSLADGTYQIDYGADGGLPKGNYRVTVTRTETLDGKPSPQSEEGAAALAAGKAVHRRYVLEKEIINSSPTFDLVLDDAKQE